MKTFEEMLTKNADEQDLQDLIAMAEGEIIEWEDFIKTCKKRMVK